MHYGGTSANALPGIVDVIERPTRKEYYKLSEPDHKNLVLLANDTRMPLNYITASGKKSKKKSKARSPAFPSPKEHLKRAKGWDQDFHMAVSTHNSVHHGSQREYFDRPFIVPR